MILEEFLMEIIPYLAGFLEVIGVLIILLGSLEALYRLIKSRLDFGDEELKINFAKSLALSLQFKLAAEILKSVVVKTLDEFIILSAIVVLRVIITFVLSWEIKSSEKIEVLEKRIEKENMSLEEEIKNS